MQCFTLVQTGKSSHVFRQAFITFLIHKKGNDKSKSIQIQHRHIEPSGKQGIFKVCTLQKLSVENLTARFKLSSRVSQFSRMQWNLQDGKCCTNTFHTAVESRHSKRSILGFRESWGVFTWISQLLIKRKKTRHYM